MHTPAARQGDPSVADHRFDFNKFICTLAVCVHMRVCVCVTTVFPPMRCDGALFSDGHRAAVADGLFDAEQRQVDGDAVGVADGQARFGVGVGLGQRVHLAVLNRSAALAGRRRTVGWTRNIE